MNTLLHLQVRSVRLLWPATILLLLLQRTPVVRVLVHVEALVGPRTGQILRAMLPAAFALGATHTLTGQTTVVFNPESPVSGTVGTSLNVVFIATGIAALSPESYAIVGTLPPGITVPGATGPAGNLTINASFGSFEGTPTVAGSYAVQVAGYDGPDRTADTTGFITFEFEIADGTAPPAFSTHPVSQSVAAGATVTFTVAVTGSPAPTLQWRKGQVPINGQTGTSLVLSNVTATDAGSYDVVANNAQGSVTSNAATLTVNVPAAPTIVTQPVAMTSRQGSGAFFAVVAEGSGLSYQWRHDNADLPGQTNPSLFLADVQSADAGNYSVRISNSGGTIDSDAVALTIVTTGLARLVNLSTRAQVGTGADILIPGFVIGGTGNKSLLVRAVGPKLLEFGVASAITDPRMQQFAGATPGISNDDWPLFPDQTALETTRQAVFAFDLRPSIKDASILASLPAGAINYTVQVSGVNEVTGVSLVELYDADPLDSPARLVNISARAQVGTGNDILIPGFFISGDVALTLLIRAVGPSIADLVPNTLGDPVMTLYRTVDATRSDRVADNDNWEQSPNLPALQAATTATFAFELKSGFADAAMLVALNPGGYTVQVSGKNNGTGVSLVELYLVGP